MLRYETSTCRYLRVVWLLTVEQDGGIVVSISTEVDQYIDNEGTKYNDG